MKRTILIIFAILLGVAALAGAGFVGFQMGIHKAAAFQSGDGKAFEQFHRFGRDGMPMDEFHRFGGPQFEQQIGRDGERVKFHHGGRGFSTILFKLTFLGLLVWLGYQLFKGNGWQLTLARVQPMVEPEKPKPTGKSKKGKQ